MWALLLEASLALSDGTGQHGGQLRFGTAEALGVSCGHVESDGDWRASTLCSNTETAIGSPRQGEDGFGAGFACDAGAATCEWESNRRRDDAT